MGMGDGPGTRVWIRWLGLAVFVIVLGVVFFFLGEWQLDRLDQRKASNAIIVEHQNAPVVAFEDVFDTPVTDSDQWQRVRATGTFDATKQFQVRYRNNGGKRGIEVVTPLRTESGTVVLVNRGFIETNTSEIASLPDPPAGIVTVIGHARRSEIGSPEAVTPVDQMMRLINAPAISQSLGYTVPDGYIGLLEVTPAQTGAFEPVEPPPLDEGPHFWYAVQWFMFAAIAVTGLFVFIRNDLRALAARKAERTATPVAKSREDHP